MLRWTRQISGLACAEHTLRSMEGRRRSSPALRKERSAQAVQGGSRGGLRHKRGPGERLLDPSCELEVCTAADKTRLRLSTAASPLIILLEAPPASSRVCWRSYHRTSILRPRQHGVCSRPRMYLGLFVATQQAVEVDPLSIKRPKRVYLKTPERNTLSVAWYTKCLSCLWQRWTADKYEWVAF